jgi:hypothetical protein
MVNILKSIENIGKNRDFMLIFLLVLVGFVIVDCNTKMFSKLIEGQGGDAGSGNNNSVNSPSDTCGRVTGQPASNPNDSASRDCDLSGVNSMGGPEKTVLKGNIEGEQLYVSAQGPYGREIPKTLQGDYSTLKSFGLTNLKDVVNYLPGAGPSQFSKGADNNDASGVGIVVSDSANNNNNDNSCKPIVYGADWCGWTKKQKKYLEDKGIEHTYVDCAKDKGSCPPEVKGFPAIKHCDGNLTPGYQEI